ncbi:MAG: DUF4760 domain-containing protein [Gammaproteobacteria bacterium]|nr:DUF4760 domain-containing protein [Gammaproteobacteria bacterium]
MDLNTLANLAEILSASTVVGGVVFGLAQIKQMRHQRRDANAIAFLDSVQDSEFARAYLRLMRLPDGITLDEIRGRETKYEEAAIVLATNFETVGLMVFRDLVDFSIVRDLVGDAVIQIWKKLDRWVQDLRDEQGRDTVFDWFEWLAGKLDEDDVERAQHAMFVKRRKWRPNNTVF